MAEASPLIDDEYLISVAKTEYREAYNTSDVDRLLSVFAPQFIDWSDSEPSFYREEAPQALKIRSQALFARYQVKLTIIMARVSVMGNFAMDRGWHKLQLTDKNTGETTKEMYRYLETWAKTDAGWKINCIITNREPPLALLPENPAG